MYPSSFSSATQLDQEFGRILEDSLNEIYLFDAESHRFLLVNRGARENLGYSMRELHQLTPIDIKPNLSPEVFARLLRPLRSGLRHTVCFNTLHQRKDGSRYDVEVHLQLSTCHGKPVFVSIVLDTTDRRRSFRSIAEKRARLQAVLETAVEGIITIDERGNCESVNRAAEEIFGYRADEMVGKNVSLLMPSPFREEHDAYIANYLRTGEQKIIGIGREVTGRRKDGTLFPMDLSVSEVKLENRRLFTGIIRDITERKQAEKTIAENQRQLATLIANLPGAAYRCKNDRNWTMEFISVGCFELFGYEAKEFIEQRVMLGDLIHSEDRDNVWNTVQDHLTERKQFQITYRIRHADGEYRWIWEKGSGVFSRDGELVAIERFMTDVTDLKKAQDRLVRSERLAAVGEAMTSVVHESRNLLQKIQMAVEIGCQESNDQELNRQFANIERATDGLQALLGEVRSYAAPIRLEIERVELPQLWREAWQQLEREREHRVADLREEVLDVEMRCRVDRFRIVQVFRNLFENSLAACTDPAEITVSVSESHTGGDSALYVTVLDNGPGLDEEQHRRIFEPFFTTKSKGTGLGMAIAQRIMEAHGGQIVAARREGLGAEFRIDFPR